MSLKSQKSFVLICRETQVGETLSEKTTGRVVISVLAMLFVIPVLQYQFHDGSGDTAMLLFQEFNIHRPVNWVPSVQSLLTVMNDTSSGMIQPVVYLQFTPGGGDAASAGIDLPEYYSNLRVFPYGSEIDKLYIESESIDGTVFTTTAWFMTKEASVVRLNFEWYPLYMISG